MTIKPLDDINNAIGYQPVIDNKFWSLFTITYTNSASG